jgi:hypothetical protein
MIDCETPRLGYTDVSKHRRDSLYVSALKVRRQFEISIMIDCNFVANIWRAVIILVEVQAFSVLFFWEFFYEFKIQEQ